MSEFYGVFSNYEIEDVYKFIGTEKLDKRLKELELTPTMGTTLYDFVSKDIKYLGVGVINIFNMKKIVILRFLQNNLRSKTLKK